MQLIMGLAADAPHESSSLQPVCFHGNRISNYGARAPLLLPTRWRLMRMKHRQPSARFFFFLLPLPLGLSRGKGGH